MSCFLVGDHELMSLACKTDVHSHRLCICSVAAVTFASFLCKCSMVLL